jgi:hypothetical protein
LHRLSPPELTTRIVPITIASPWPPSSTSLWTEHSRAALPFRLSFALPCGSVMLTDLLVLSGTRRSHRNAVLAIVWHGRRHPSRRQLPLLHLRHHRLRCEVTVSS